MKNFRKIIAVMLAVVMCFSIFAISASAEEKLNYLVLGDSIAEGFGVVNRDEACFGRIVADTNGYNYTNLGLMGRTSESLRYRVENDYTFINAVKNADIISLSIGGNDFMLSDDVVFLFLEGLFGGHKHLDEVKNAYYENLVYTINLIHEMNPDVVILVQTLYNAWNSFAKVPFQAVVNCINDTIKRIDEEMPGSIEIVDVEPVLSHHVEYITTDTIHPNSLGNIEIAKLVLAKLVDLGLGETAEPVVLVEGIDRDYITEYLGKPFGPIVQFIADWASGTLR